MSASSEETERAGLCESREVAGGLICGSIGLRIGDFGGAEVSPVADSAFLLIDWESDPAHCLVGSGE